MHSASHTFANNSTKVVNRECKQLRVASKVKMSQHQKASTYLDDEPMAEEPSDDQFPFASDQNN